jgi:hypothetical protein
MLSWDGILCAENLTKLQQKLAEFLSPPTTWLLKEGWVIGR